MNSVPPLWSSVKCNEFTVSSFFTDKAPAGKRDEGRGTRIG